MLLVLWGASLGAVPGESLAAASELPGDDYSLSIAALEQLERSGRLELTSATAPGVQLRLVRVQRTDSGHTYLVTSDSGNGVITRSGNRFFATIQTSQGVLSIHGERGASRGVHDYWLRSRELPLEDFRAPPR